MIIMAATIWLIGVMFTWGLYAATYIVIDDVTWRDWAVLALVAPFTWPAFLGIFAKGRLD